MNYRILLFYKYITFAEPQKFVEEHLKFCHEHDIKGRVWISSEGINATVSGLTANIEKYKNEISSYPEFSDLWFKEDPYFEHAFNKIHVRLKSEIVNASFGEVDLNKTGKYLSPEKLNELYESGKDFIIVDARNEYESAIGKFRNAITPKMETFRDWVKVASDLKDQREKTIVTYCTGGIRCEKASAYLVEQGFKDVYQIKGGIWNYIKQFPDKYWEGSMFVFDERRIVTPNKSEELKHIGECYYCGKKTSYYINCHNQVCNKMIITCHECKVTNDYCCCEGCRNSVNKRTAYHG